MKALRTFLAPCAACLLLIGLLTACESTETASGGAAYYGTSFYDPWYYGYVYYNDDTVVVGPPSGDRPRPEHPIANPPTASAPRPTPMPSIPSIPMAVPRGGR